MCFVINDIAVCGCVYFIAPSEHAFIYGMIMVYDLNHKVLENRYFCCFC